MKRRIPVITKKVLAFISLSGFVLCTLIFAAAYWSFSRLFKNQYASTVQSVAAAARECLNPDDFTSYILQKTPDEKYMNVKAILQDFVDKFDLNLLYVSSVEPPDYTHITYIYNPVKKGGKWKEFPIGYEENYIESNYNNSTRRVFEQGETVVRHTIKTRSGSHITAQLPVYDSNGNVVAVVGTQKDIQEFVKARRSYTIFVVAMELCFSRLHSQSCLVVHSTQCS